MFNFMLNMCEKAFHGQALPVPTGSVYGDSQTYLDLGEETPRVGGEENEGKGWGMEMGGRKKGGN